MKRPMTIFVISLPDALQRRASIARQMAHLGLPFSFIDGVRIGAEELAARGYDEPSRLLRYAYGMSVGEVGCFLAHRAAWRAVRDEPGKCLVLEDDAVVAGLTPALLEQLGETPYPLVRLAGVFEKKHKFIGQSAIAKYWGDPSGAAAYVLGPREAARLLQKSERFYMPVDDFMEARYLHGLHTYALLPYPVKQAGTDTQIGDRARPPLRWSARFRLMLVRIPIDLKKYVYRLSYYLG